MSAGDVLAVVAATVVTMLIAVLAATLVALTRTLRELRATADALHDEAIPLLDAAREAVTEAAIEVDRVERLVTSAERVSGAVDGASRLAARTLRSPVVKAMAFGTGVSRAAQRLREGEPATPAVRKRRRKRKASTSRDAPKTTAAPTAATQSATSKQLAAKPKAS
jgi:hypothetical protein